MALNKNELETAVASVLVNGKEPNNKIIQEVKPYLQPVAAAADASLKQVHEMAAELTHKKDSGYKTPTPKKP